ncbi:MAG: hypothetical protein VKM97_07815, partial [Cyanobacteriota bacterium]|nr:hypothetical protein [Cyanobacteriota bacterium]
MSENLFKTISYSRITSYADGGYWEEDANLSFDRIIGLNGNYGISFINKTYDEIYNNNSYAVNNNGLKASIISIYGVNKKNEFFNISWELDQDPTASSLPKLRLSSFNTYKEVSPSIIEIKNYWTDSWTDGNWSSQVIGNYEIIGPGDIWKVNDIKLDRLNSKSFSSVGAVAHYGAKTADGFSLKYDPFNVSIKLANNGLIFKTNYSEEASLFGVPYNKYLHQSTAKLWTSNNSYEGLILEAEVSAIKNSWYWDLYGIVPDPGTSVSMLYSRDIFYNNRPYSPINSRYVYQDLYNEIYYPDDFHQTTKITSTLDDRNRPIAFNGEFNNTRLGINNGISSKETGSSVITYMDNVELGSEFSQLLTDEFQILLKDIYGRTQAYLSNDLDTQGVDIGSWEEFYNKLMQLETIAAKLSSNLGILNTGQIFFTSTPFDNTTSAGDKISLTTSNAVVLAAANGTPFSARTYEAQIARILKAGSGLASLENDST